jgi:hypothetical protein
LVVEAAGAGFVTSLLNPYWHLWWVTQPTLLLASAAAQGWPGVGAFFAGHISADLLWYSLTSYGISRGHSLLAGRVYQGLLIGCAAMLLVMAALFAALVIQKLAGPTGACLVSPRPACRQAGEYTGGQVLTGAPRATPAPRVFTGG